LRVAADSGSGIDVEDEILHGARRAAARHGQNEKDRKC
jgi:hypothetical protein